MKAKNNLALKIIPELNSPARFGISGSFIKSNQIFDRKNAIDKPKKIKRLQTTNRKGFFLFLAS